MNRTSLLPLVSLCAMACTADRDSTAPVQRAATGEQVPTPTTVENSVMSGQEAYETTCAHCHDAGLNGAPVTRNAADWEMRSPLWQAVLMEHAKDGYFGMPAKGGNPELPDITVSAAAEYMLEITFPNLPRD